MPEILLLKGDITSLEVDAIVNAANSGLRGGGGVDGAIHRAGGPAIMQACKQVLKEIGHLPVGEAVMTTAGAMPAKFVIHTVGPVYDADRPEEMRILLGHCYTNVLDLAVRKQLKSVAFPNISTGVYGFPKEEAAQVAIDKVRRAIHSGIPLERIIFVCFDVENYHIYNALLQ